MKHDPRYKFAWSESRWVLYGPNRGYVSKHNVLGGATRALALERLRNPKTDATLHINEDGQLKPHNP